MKFVDRTKLAAKCGKLEAHLLRLPKSPEREQVINTYLELVDVLKLETDFAEVVGMDSFR